MNNRIFSHPLTQTTFAEWSKRHYGHRKKMQICKETYGRGPDVRRIWCLDCMKLFILDFITEGEIDVL